MNDLVIHPVTSRQLKDFVDRPSHAVLLVGPSGSGKGVLAIKLSEAMLELPAGGFVDYPYKLVIGHEDGKSIGIEAIRELERFLSLKVPSRAVHNRAVIIEDAHLLSTEAQNALLKTLEEPSQGSFIILAANNEQALLPTIRSRVQSISLKRPERLPAEAYFQTQSFNDKAIRQAYAISGGLPGLMHALLDQTEHPLTLATQHARQLLSQSAYERLLTVDELAKQRQLAANIVFIFQQMAHVSLQTAGSETAPKWQAVLRAGYRAAEALEGNAQPKLVLTDLMLSF